MSVSVSSSNKKDDNFNKFEWKPTLIFLFAICLGLFLVGTYIFVSTDYSKTNSFNTVNMGFDMIGMISAIILLGAIERDSSVLDEISHIFAFCVGLMIVGFFMDLTICRADGNKALSTHTLL